MTLFQRLEPADYRRVRWRNDGGWTTEIASAASDDPSGGVDFRWRISIAEIERDGPFSVFPGIDRDLLLLDGTGIELDIDDAPPQRLTRRFERAQFAGEANVMCRLLAGPTRDFNVMTRRDCVRAVVIARPLVGSMVVLPEPHTQWFVHVLSGNVRARGTDRHFALEAGTSLQFDFRTADAGRVVLDGTGELVFAKFTATDAR